ncbi:hypothetical protein cypCar_00004281 [Cyprinus carpio]|nr:hypothetical protein cypCar_00004281 [Cyprinus carpio]
MDTEDLPANNAPLTVNEQVIVMSGQETIRVLEVEVDTALSSSGTDGKAESGGEEAAVHILEAAEEAPLESPVTTNTTTAVSLEVSAPAVQTVVSKAPISVSLAQPQSSLPITVQACPQVLTQDGLASLMTGMFAQQGSLGQPLLIPLTATVLNSVQTQLQSPAQAVLQPQVSALQPTQTTTATTASVVQKVTEPSASVATLQTAGLSINPAIISAASLGAQPQFISSLTTTPIITSAVSNVTGQLITNAQGQVIGTLPLLFNPAAASALPAQGLQVQTMSPQLFFNSQGQIIATIGNGPTAAAPSATPVLPKSNVPLTLTKTTTPGPVGRVAPSKVIIAPQPQVVKSVTSLTSAGAIACGDVPTVGQLVSKPQSAVNEEEAINLEEIREFAKNFKIRRLSLGLTQTQVGQALTATEGPAYSQSAICRFEKLDITPKSAQKLKPVLERWLVEAELWNQKGQQNLMEFVGGEPSKKRKRRTSFTPQAIEVLNTYFEKNSLPTGQEITEIAKELNYDREVVRVWFCNRRQTLKNTSKINVFQSQ